MVNTNIQGAVQIDGAGYRAKIKRQYNPGEYRQLQNCELREGMIHNRRPILACDETNDTLVPLDNSLAIVGSANSYVFACSATTQIATEGNTGYLTLWAPTSLPDNGHADSYHRIVHVYFYNDQYCWLTMEYEGDTGLFIYHLYTYPNSVSLNISTIAFGSLTHTELFTGSSVFSIFRNAFVQGERLWIVLADRIYFSAATDHTDFVVPNGGFFDFQSQSFNFGLFYRNSIYVLTDRAIFSITYTNDPNVDSQAVQVSDSVGGESGIVHNDTIYVVNKIGIYSVINNAIELLMENTVFDVGFTHVYRYKLAAFQEYLVLLRYNTINYNGASFSTNEAIYYGNQGFVYEPSPTNLLGHNLFFINTLSGAVHVVNFKDQLDTASPGVIVDMHFNSKQDISGVRKLFFLTNKKIQNTVAPYEYESHLYAMNSSYGFLLYDTAVRSDGVVKRYRANYVVEIEGYTPDGTEYLMKKFRHLQIMGTHPYISFELKIAFDNKDYPAQGTALTVKNSDIDAVGEPRSHFPFRVGINQRARSISIYLYTTDTTSPLESPGDTIYDWFQISDIEILWTYTGRGNKYRSPTITS